MNPNWWGISMIPLLFPVNKTKIYAMSGKRDIHGLIRVLYSRDPEIQALTIGALAQIGPEATGDLVTALGNKNRNFVLGVIATLAEIKDPRAIPSLIIKLHDPGNEVRWQTAVTMGELGYPDFIGPLLESIWDPDKYVRFGSAEALRKIGWKPETATERAWNWAAFQDWENLGKMGKDALPVLTSLMRDSDSVVRIHAVKAMGDIGDEAACPALIHALGDENRQVRWEATLASQKCRVPAHFLPRGLRSRPLMKKNPFIAGFLNFLLPGLGYGYLGKWWGIMIFQIDITLTVWLFRSEGETNTYLVLLPLYLFLAAHAWYVAKRLPEEPT